MHQRKSLLGIVVILAVCLCGAQLIAQSETAKKAPPIPPATFMPAVDYTVGKLPFANAVGDFNGDHKLDIAACNYSSNNVSVLLGNGDGTFQTAVNYAVGTEPSAITVADLNNDGYPDIAVADEIGNTIAILINNADGTGTFKPAVLYPAGHAPRGITAGSLRNNGILDLVVANNLGGNVTVFLGNGDGTFQTGVNYTAHTNPKSVALGDLNGDGILDIAVANHNTNDVSILIGNGDGTFKAPVNYPTGIDPRHVLIFDFNKDGKLDLAVANGGESTVSILYGNGDGTFQPQAKYTANASPRWLAVADYNNDGFLDIATSNYNGKNVSVLLGTGSSTAGQAFLAHQDYTVGPNPTGLVAGDFTGSGLPDIAVTVGGLPTLPNTYMGVLLNNPGTITPTSLTFASQTVNTTSAPQAITLTSSAPNAIAINNISFGGTDPSDFSETNTCGSQLSGLSNCAINVTFTPTASGTRSATMTVTYNGGGTSQTATLTGTGAGATNNLTVAPTSLIFPAQQLGTSSTAQVITLTNSNATSITFTSIAISGTNANNFSQTNNCGTTLLANTSCTINVTFKPSGVNTRTAAVTITDSAGNSPQTVPLQGIGTAVSLSPTSLTFPAQTVGTTSSPQAITFTNVSTTGTIVISKLSFTGTNATDFAQTNTCGGKVGPKGTCTISVTFTPGATGARSASLSISDSGGGSPQLVPLSGTGQ